MLITTMASQQPVQPKKNSKSRNGCLTCKKKRLKCDETKPHCLNCTKKNISCGGYSTNFKWKSFEETTTSQKIKKQRKSSISDVNNTTGKPSKELSKSMERAMSEPNSNIFQSALQKASISIAGKTFQELARQNELMSMGMNPNLNSNIEDLSTGSSGPSSRRSSQPYPLIRTMSEGSKPKDLNHQDISLPKLELPGLQPGIQHQKIPILPKLMEYDLDPLTTNQNTSAIIDDDEELSLEEDPKNFKRASSVDSIFNSDSIESSLELFQFQNAFKQFHLDLPEKFLINTSPSNFNQEFNKISTAFHNFTSPIMTVKTFSENPWQTYIWPMALEHSVLFKAIAAMTMAHLGRTDPDLKQQSTVYMKQSINELAQGLTNNSISNDVALATCFTLSVTESWYTQITTGIAHLRGARSIIQKVFKEEDVTQLSPAFKWLCASFIYHDVLSKLVSSTLIDSNTYDEDSFFFKHLKTVKNPSARDFLLHPEDLESPSTSESIYFSMDDIDPLLGCARDLFFIIGRTATLITKFKTHKKTLEMVSNAVHYQNELLNWKPNMQNFSKNLASDPYCDSNSLISTAESYRYATLLYLHQAIPEIPSQSSKTLAKKILMLLASIPTNSRTGLIHIFPLLVASCEMDEPEDRLWIENRWSILSKMMLLGNLDRAHEIVKEVWKRKDERISIRSGSTTPKIEVGGNTSGGSGVNDWGIEKRIENLIGDDDDLEQKGINSRTHWSCIMKEWGWEVLLG
ncbi:TY1 enhancer activator [Wickerhamomyces ciferrii]|uniref:TY1 enhancer activator n=1 Tax=Wickerhamomyces ciferrii (strain ATCC 14091 / BCRC 22168 / CBS 111 / JCM 3599 / NBRC 0793 / NRRL Y-1031 F-60-10) TaxID=1206466 RepID=K0KLB6_WICCF|nr:TY1 enhancer activator [Wickerhamomyces ciferrii]CCH46050.1 TY1 enhancer activator [Wickerhamomyces ciferrii]